MPWECLGCGLRNKDGLANCDECSLDKETATTMQVKVKKRCCRDCGHIHRAKEFCHVYVEVDEDYVDDEEEEDEEEDSEDEEDALGYNKLKMLKGGAPKEEAKEHKPLTTPSYVKRTGYARCNCETGVPVHSRRYEVVPKIMYVGGIQICTEVEVRHQETFGKPKEFVGYQSKDDEKRARAEAKRAKDYEFAEMLPYVMEFIELRFVAHSALVSKHFNYGCSQYKYYTDVRDSVPWNVLRPHQGEVESVVMITDHSSGVHLAVSAGDRRVLISNSATGQVLQVVTRDSGKLPHLLYHDTELYASSSNGSVRSYTVPHDLKRIAPHFTMWEHSRSVRRVMLSLPSRGFCALHGLKGHICYLYTVSEDRTICMWNIATCQPVRNYTSNVLRQSVLTSLSQSPRHLMAGTSDASVVVFTKDNVCERHDIHGCNTPGAARTGCLQITLRLSEKGGHRAQSGEMPTVNAVLCTGLNHGFDYVVAADSVGQMSVWENPQQEGLGFHAVTYWKAHRLAINDMVATARHLLTVSDDGYLVMHDIVTFASIRAIHVVQWTLDKGLITKPEIPRRIKCIHVKEDPWGVAGGGTMLIGTNYGEVMVSAIGTTI